MDRWRRATHLFALVLVLAACASDADSVDVGAARDGVRFPVHDPGDDPHGDPAVEPSSSRSRRTTRGTGGSLVGEIVTPGSRRPTANVCGSRDVITTGPVVQFPWAPPCVEPALAPAQPTARGVTRTTIRIAYYVSGDPKIQQAAKSAGGCGTVDCIERYARGYTAWFNRYFELYGRQVVVEPYTGAASEASGSLAEADADALAAGGYFAVLNGPGEAGARFAARLASHGVLCICTISLPEEFYAAHQPYVWTWLMSSTQAYVHRAAYIKRLAGRTARWAGTPEMRARQRRFGLVWFDNPDHAYEAGVESFYERLAELDVTLATSIRYVNIEGCQTSASNIIEELFDAQVTSVIFSGDPLCPTSLTAAAQARSAPWEWIVSGSIYTDTNRFGRLYDQSQWRRAFGVSMLTPDLPIEREHWARMLREVDPTITLKSDMPATLQPFVPFFSGVHMAGPVLTVESFAKGLRSLPVAGGTVTVPRRSYGPKRIGGEVMPDLSSFDDMTEIWWDPDAADANGDRGVYRYVDRGRRYTWDQWPTDAPSAFTRTNAIIGYERAPDQ